jgi:hypothetical protein
MLMVDRLDVTVVAVVEVMHNGTVLNGMPVPRNQTPVHPTIMLHKFPTLLTERGSQNGRGFGRGAYGNNNNA